MGEGRGGGRGVGLVVMVDEVVVVVCVSSRGAETFLSHAIVHDAAQAETEGLAAVDAAAAAEGYGARAPK